ncbi:MAG: sugar phosphate isomerase/epimerase [Clostridia bacterium]|nr:sugar phosphate isomerase/epimerase [Clostridia bacterium]
MSNKLCLSLGMQLEASLKEQLILLKNAGFDAFAFDRERHGTSDLARELIGEGNRLGLSCEYIHAPFYGMDDIFHDEGGVLAEIMLKDLYGTIDDCHTFGVKYAVIHAIIGMDNHNPTELGLRRLEPVVNYAVQKGVSLAFENTEGEEYLEAILERFGDVPDVGFCFDSGHELCYNHGNDMLGRFGKRLMVTHLNDNVGMTGDELTFLDDAHLLPFDGIADWERIAERMHNCGYDGTLSFEVISKGRPNRTENDIYKSLTDTEYVNLAYERAVKFIELFNSKR